MRISWCLPFVVLASACSVGPVFKVPAKKQACSESFLDWTGGLTYDVLQGSGNGKFSYAPIATQWQTREGGFGMKDGSLWWDGQYRDGHFRDLERARGEGKIWRDGDMDIVYQRFVSYNDGRGETEEWVRHIRLGCEESLEIADEDGAVQWDERGLYADGVYTYEGERITTRGVATVTGERRSDGTYTEVVNIVGGGSYTEEGDHHGVVMRNLELKLGTSLVTGSASFDPESGFDFAYVSAPFSGADERWTFSVDADGNGGGLYERGQQSCTLKYEQGECSLASCTDGGDGACFPVMSPLDF